MIQLQWWNFSAISAIASYPKVAHLNKLHTLWKNKQNPNGHNAFYRGASVKTLLLAYHKGKQHSQPSLMFLMCTFFLGMEVHGRRGTNDHSFRNLIDAQKRLEDAWQSKMRGHGLKSVLQMIIQRDRPLANDHPENCLFLVLNLFQNTYGSVCAGREKWPFNVIFFLK